MTAAEIQQRVDAWLAANQAAVGDSRRGRELSAQWQAVTRMFGANSDAATGVLLGLACEAWGCDDWRRLTIEPAGAGWCVVVRNGRHRPPSRAQPGWTLDQVAHPRYRDERSPFGLNEFDSHTDALVVALEAAP